MWPCDIAGCIKTSVRKDGECVLCNRHLCAQHLAAEYHTCPAWEDELKYDPAARNAERDEITNLIARIDIVALLARASDLRGGISCTTPIDLQYDRSTRSAMMGGMNYHIELLFEDGISWLARIRRSNATSPPAKLRNYIMRSEVSTLQFLSKTNIPVPKVFDFKLDEANPVGVGYILMEKLPGKSLRWSVTAPEQRKKVIRQLADIYIELKTYPFSAMGSLDQLGSFNIGPFAKESLTDFFDSQMKLLGPFTSMEKYFTAQIQLILDLVVRQELYTNRPVDAFLIHRFLLDHISAVCSPKDLDDGKYYLKHADEKGDQILVDEDWNITGIIDWEWAHTDSKSGAFNSPIVLLPVADFYDGANCIGEDEKYLAQCLEEKGHIDLGNIVRNGRLIHRFRFCCGYDLGDWEGFLGLFAGLLGALGITDSFDWEVWKTETFYHYQSDERLHEILNFH